MGADLIIGPLRKDKARPSLELAARANMPALLLNYMEQALRDSAALRMTQEAKSIS